MVRNSMPPSFLDSMLQVPLLLLLVFIAASSTSAAPPTPGTRITLYNAAGYKNSPSTLAPTVIRPDPTVGCYNLGGSFAQRLGSGLVEWNVKDNSSSHIICTIVWFYSGQDCTGDAVGRMIPGTAAKADPSKYNYSNAAWSGFNATFKATSSIACKYTPDPCAAFPCSSLGYATCDSASGTARKCSCQPGLVLSGGKCVDKCKTTTCPAHSSCQVISNTATCVCSDGYIKQGGSCVLKPASYGWLEAHNTARAAVKSPALVWNDTLAQAATAWAKTLVSTSCLNATTVQSGSYGQNALAAGSPWDPTDVVAAWVEEKAKYTLAAYPSGCSEPLRNCVHYIRAVWNTTTAVGCGQATCTDGSVTYVCDYFPKGGISGQLPY